MSSSSSARVTLQTERRSINDNSNSSKPRMASGSSGIKTERSDGRIPQPPQPSAGGPSHKRMPSGSQRTSRNVEERRTEKVQVTTRETLISRTRSPDRRPGSSAVAPERARAVEVIRNSTKDTGSKTTRGEPPSGMLLSPAPSRTNCCKFA
jgi:gamma-tubulin complex component 2